MGNIKLKDIADVLNISNVTVSNALLGKKGVSSEVRDMILKTAKEMGYDLSRYEKTEKSNMIGVIVANKYLEVGVSFYWAMYQKVAYVASKRHGVTTFEVLDPDSERQGILPNMVHRKTVDGLVVIGWVDKAYVEKLVKQSGVPVVLLDFSIRDIPCDAVMSGNYFGMYKATRNLIEHGHRDIAFVGSIRDNRNIFDRYYGYKKGLLEAGVKIRKEWCLEDRDLITGEIKIHLPEHMPTAFACNSDLTASYLYDALTAKGYHVPDDISVVGYDNYLFGHSFAEKLTTYNVDMERMAKVAVKLLMRRIQGDKKHFETRYIDSEVIERYSVKTLK